MKVPVQVSFHGLPVSDALEALCVKETAKLERYHGQITTCRIAVRVPHRRHEKGNLYSIHVRLGVPGGEIEVNREPSERHAHEDPRAAVRDAFDAARRRLQDFVRRQEGRTKRHDQRASAR